MKSVRAEYMLIVAGALLLAAEGAHAVGEAGAQFLRIGVGARSCAMGGAFVGLADDASAIYWNPAGLTQVCRVQVTATHDSWLLDMNHEWAAVVLPVPSGAIAGSFTYLGSGSIPRVEDFEVVGEYSSRDLCVSLAYAHRLGEMLSIGGSVKYIELRIDDEDASGWSGDFGLLLRTSPEGGFRAGFSALNTGRALTFIEGEDPLPIDLRGGASYEFGGMTVAAAVLQPRFGDLKWGGGIEASWRDTFFARIGYNSAASYSAGVGARWERVAVDYAYTPYESIDDVHRVGVTIEF